MILVDKKDSKSSISRLNLLPGHLRICVHIDFINMVMVLQVCNQDRFPTLGRVRPV
jgi:hypothetical protein